MTQNSLPLTPSKTLVASMHDLHIGIIILDTDNKLIQANAAACTLFGKLPQEGTALSETWLKQQTIQINNLESQAVTMESLFSATSLVVCIETLQQKNWRSVQCEETQWQDRPVKIMIFTDINELVENYIQLKQQSKYADVRDTITGLHNRRHALEYMQQMHNRGKRYGGQFTVALIDIDHFKRINDTYGQAFGDEVIAKIAQTLKSVLRETDFCARYGGEEFLVLMPETSMMDAVVTLDRLRQQIFELKWQNRPPPITVSAGVHMWQRNKSIEQLLFETDQRLNMAKKAGRNQVCGDLS